MDRINSPFSPQTTTVVLSTPELLEGILLQVDVVTLLVSASRVSRYWLRVISDSPKLQEALFFKPISRRTGHSSDSNGQLRASDRANVVRRVINPLLAKKFGKCFFDTEGNHGYHHRSSSFQELPWSGGRYRNDGLSDLRCKIANINGSPEAQASRRRFTRSGASWRRMLVSQPPPLLLGYTWMKRMMLKATVSAALVKPVSENRDNIGLCMGQLYDIVQYQAAHHTQNSVWFRIIWYRPREPSVLDFCYETSQKLLHQTCIVTEFYHKDDEVYPTDPVDVQKFDEELRCKDFQQHDVIPGLLRKAENSFAEWCPSSTVYDRSWYPSWRYLDRL